jgi:hypothetical protein
VGMSLALDHLKVAARVVFVSAIADTSKASLNFIVHFLAQMYAYKTSLTMQQIQSPCLREFPQVFHRFCSGYAPQQNEKNRPGCPGRFLSIYVKTGLRQH